MFTVIRTTSNSEIVYSLFILELLGLLEEAVILKWKKRRLNWNADYSITTQQILIILHAHDRQFQDLYFYI